MLTFRLLPGSCVTTFPAQVEQSPYLKKRWDCKQRLVMDWVHFLTHPLYDFD